MSSISPAVCESRLVAHLTKTAKTRRSDTVSLIEIVDEAALWDDPFTDLTAALCETDFESLMTRDQGRPSPGLGKGNARKGISCVCHAAPYPRTNPTS